MSSPATTHTQTHSPHKWKPEPNDIPHEYIYCRNCGADTVYVTRPLHDKMTPRPHHTAHTEITYECTECTQRTPQSEVQPSG